MKLSEAIKRGALLRPQCTGKAFKLMPDDTTIGSCALGAALEGAGLIGKPLASETMYLYKQLVMDEWPELDERKVIVPPTDESDFLVYAIEKLNDHHEWSRERIAEWVGGMGL